MLGYGPEEGRINGRKITGRSVQAIEGYLLQVQVVDSSDPGQTITLHKKGYLPFVRCSIVERLCTFKGKKEKKERASV